MLGNKANQVDLIPYLSNSGKEVEDAFYAFGIVLGAIVRLSLPQNIKFPNFVWNFLAGKPITMSDIYENDKSLKEMIEGIRNGSISHDRMRTYCDWDFSVRSINGFPSDMQITPDFVDVYEKIVVSMGIKSIEKWLLIIRNGFWENQEISKPELLSGGLVEFLCSSSEIDTKRIIDNLIFENWEKRLKNFLITILSGYDQEKMRKFLWFVTNQYSHSRFNVPKIESILEIIYINFKKRILSGEL